MTARSRPAGKLASPRSAIPASIRPRHPDGSLGLPFSREQILQRRLVKICFRQQLLQTAVLRLKLLQVLGIRHRHPAVFGLLVVEGGLADPVFPAQLGRLGLRFRFQTALIRGSRSLVIHPRRNWLHRGLSIGFTGEPGWSRVVRSSLTSAN